MLCPRCQTNLNIGDKQGIEIDYCTSCRGIWLDGGELEKIIERSGVDNRKEEKESWWERIIDIFD